MRTTYYSQERGTSWMVDGTNTGK